MAKRKGAISRMKTQHNKRVTKRVSASDKRIEKRANSSDKRIAKRSNVSSAKINKRQANKLQKVYGKLSPEEIDGINSVTPYTSQMANQLQDDGVQIEDVNDPIEVASKYVQLSPDMDDPIDEDTYNDAYANTEEDFDSHFDYAKAKANARRLVKGALGGVVNELGVYVDELADKEKLGMPLTPAEQQLLNANKKANNYVQGAIMDKIMANLKQYGIYYIGGGILLYVVIKHLRK